jgi:hypothetical protein
MKPLKALASIFIPLVLFILLVVFTDPLKLPLIFLVAPFILLALFVYRLSGFLLRHAGLSVKKSRFISGVVTGLLLLLMLMQSIRQLTIKDLLILAALLIGVTLYFKRIDF